MKVRSTAILHRLHRFHSEDGRGYAVLGFRSSTLRYPGESEFAPRFHRLAKIQDPTVRFETVASDKREVNKGRFRSDLA
jgi:hypothetical protein